jgi:hypothetical protein
MTRRLSTYFVISLVRFIPFSLSVQLLPVPLVPSRFWFPRFLTFLAQGLFILGGPSVLALGEASPNALAQLAVATLSELHALFE